MITFLKTLILPLAVVLPWALVSVNPDLKRFFEEKILTQPVMFFLVLLPGILVFAARITKSIFSQKQY